MTFCRNTICNKVTLLQRGNSGLLQILKSAASWLPQLKISADYIGMYNKEKIHGKLSF